MWWRGGLGVAALEDINWMVRFRCVRTLENERDLIRWPWEISNFFTGICHIVG